MQRPAGVTILAIVNFLGGATSLVMSGLTMAASWWLITETEEASSGNVSSAVARDVAFRSNLVFWMSLLRMGASLSKLVAAIGLWWRTPWGWQLALVSGVLKLGTHLLALRSAISPSAVVGLLVDSVVVVYLCTPRVRQELSGAPINAPQTPS